MSTSQNTPAIYAIKDRAPEFPAWLWNIPDGGVWERFETTPFSVEQFGWVRQCHSGSRLYSHWSPASPEAPKDAPTPSPSQGAGLPTAEKGALEFDEARMWSLRQNGMAGLDRSPGDESCKWAYDYIMQSECRLAAARAALLAGTPCCTAHQEEIADLRVQLATANAAVERANGLLDEVIREQPIDIAMRRHIFNHLEKKDAALQSHASTPGERAIKVDRPWGDYPIGTKAPAIMGGHWFRMERGWKWNGPSGSGGTFPTPGGDNNGMVILPVAPPPAAGDAERATKAAEECIAEMRSRFLQGKLCPDSVITAIIQRICFPPIDGEGWAKNAADEIRSDMHLGRMTSWRENLDGITSIILKHAPRPTAASESGAGEAAKTSGHTIHPGTLPKGIPADSRCMQDLRALNRPYPRTCEECGLGPCKRHAARNTGGTKT